MPFSVKRLLVGRPLPTDHAHHSRLPKIIALPVFASDALSSTAYASQEIMLVLMLTVLAAHDASSMGHLRDVLYIGFAIGALLIIVAVSYRQTVFAYPSGGGSYIVAKDNLGTVPGLIAAAALMTDYVLTVSVSIAAGVAAITSAFEGLLPYTLWLCLICIVGIMVANLRGLKESGSVFAVPTYTFVLSMSFLLVFGFYRYFHGTLVQYQPGASFVNPQVQALTPFLLLRAFSSGCAALTGIEAISNGVPAFRPPESRNASITLMWMAGILVTLFLGINILTYLTGAYPGLEVHQQGAHMVAAMDHGHLAEPVETLISVLARRTFDGTVLSWFYYVVQATTASILILAANTAFADFPRLASILARDRFLPRPLSNIGDRLVFSNGIFALALFSCVLTALFGGSVTRLISLYAVGVFLSFTLSQAGMVVHWFKLRTPRWQLSATVNAVGATATLVVTLIITITKFMGGAWIVVLVIPCIVMMLLKIHRHYLSVAAQLSMEHYQPQQGARHYVLVLASDMHRGVIPALQYARSISLDARALHVAVDPSNQARLRARWQRYARGIPLVILPSPYRSLVEPVLDYIRKLQQQEPNCLITMVIPEFLPSGWWPQFLHGQAGLVLTLRLRFWRGVVVTNVPYHVESYVKLGHTVPVRGDH